MRFLVVCGLLLASMICVQSINVQSIKISFGCGKRKCPGKCPGKCSGWKKTTTEDYDETTEPTTEPTTTMTEPTTERPEPNPGDWNYTRPETWFLIGWRRCEGAFQSPIMIHSKTATRQAYPKIEFVNYDRTLPIFLQNTGKTAVIHLPPDLPKETWPTISGGGLPGIFTFVHVHFHWGVSSSVGGSEHAIDNMRYMAEMQIVHINEKYANFQQALRYPDGLAVLSVFIEPQLRGNIAFRHFAELLGRTRINDDKSSVTYPFPFMDLLPDNTDDFYRYTGSLTYPPCRESVMWTVFDTPIGVSQKQMKNFRKLIGEDGIPIGDNYRLLRPIGDRVVYYRSEDGETLRQPGSDNYVPPSEIVFPVVSPGLDGVEETPRPVKPIVPMNKPYPIFPMFVKPAIDGTYGPYTYERILAG